MVHFKAELVQLAIQILLEKHDQYNELHEFIDECNDLCRIYLAKQNLFHENGKEHARQLNSELRKKYPIIDKMLDVANQMLAKGSSVYNNKCETIPIDEISELQQDHFGILYHVLLKKHRIKQIEDFISHLDSPLPLYPSSSLSGIKGASQLFPIDCQ